MSFTTVSEIEPTRIWLTPSKKQRGVSNNETRKEGSSVEEIWKWTMRPDAVATCFARDVFDMRENLVGGADFYWLGRVPCRTVSLIGLVVGLQVFESKILYSIDDGTGVIDCAHRVQRAPKTPTKKDTKKTHPISNKPMARIGLSIKVIGKVQKAYGTRQVQVDELEVCKSRNEEPLHWRRVRELHNTNYNLKEKFVIPAVAPIVAEPAILSSPVADSPMKPAKVNSVVVVDDPPKLRHPSRLHSRDLTDNTFRIYVKHYMVYAPSEAPRPANSKIAVIDQSYIPREKTRGFTLSYLRRVPELAEMARRVVMAEVKRRAKEGRRQGSISTREDLEKDKMGSKVKRLFRWAVVQLLHEGSIVLWDGAMRACGDEAHGEVSGLWKTGTSISTSAEIGSLGGTGHLDGNLTDPAADEEGYMPVTSSFLGGYVEKVMRDVNGATKEGIVRILRRDDQWGFIGEWQVQEALEYLQQESRAWQIGDRWALTS